MISLSRPIIDAKNDIFATSTGQKNDKKPQEDVCYIIE